MNSIRIRAAALTLCATAMLTLCACRKDEDENTPETDDVSAVTITYDDLDVSLYVTNVHYKGVSYTLDNENDSREKIMWDSIVRDAQVLSFPEDKVDYFFNQTRAAYMYLVDGDEEAYQLLLSNRGIDENKMREEARALVKKDMVYWYIVRAEGISLTETEKQTLFDKYADKYVSDYGYDRAYVVSNMTDVIYESMLYDKTTEYLLSLNTFEYVSVKDTAASQN